MIKENIESAFKSFEVGQRPSGYKPSKNWYVLDHSGKAYPAKAIWALASGKDPASFNTRMARRGLAELDYSLIDARTTASKDELQTDVLSSLSGSAAARRLRLKEAPRKPKTCFVLTKAFSRNPDVIAEVLHRANGRCEDCDSPAPFTKRKDGMPYLEVHHKVQLAHNGDDTVENAIALCPNCHRKSHHG
jgi:5-methylcytosine-specific restriction protein A